MAESKHFVLIHGAWVVGANAQSEDIARDTYDGLVCESGS
jgi:hypothetical protein